METEPHITLLDIYHNLRNASNSLHFDLKEMLVFGDNYNQAVVDAVKRIDNSIEKLIQIENAIRVAEENAENMRETLIWADLKIRSLPGTDQSDVEPIRRILGG